jgi:hypothetical protein
MVITLKSAALVVFTMVIIGFTACKTKELRQEISEYNHNFGNTVKKGLVLKASALNLIATKSLGEEFLKQLAPSVYAAEFIMASDSNSLRLSSRGAIRGFMHEDLAFDRTLDTLLALSSDNPMSVKPSARVLKVGNDALFSFRTAGQMTVTYSGVSEVVVGDQDPTQVMAGYRLLTFSHEKGSDKSERATIFFRAYSPASCEDCVKLGLPWQNILAKASLTVRIRPDPWFDGEEFPVLFVFEPGNKARYRWARGRGWHWPDVLSYYRNVREVMCERASPQWTCITYDHQITNVTPVGTK